MSKRLDASLKVVSPHETGTYFRALTAEVPSEPERALKLIASQMERGTTFLAGHACLTEAGKRRVAAREGVRCKAAPEQGYEEPDFEDQPSRLLVLDLDGPDLPGYDPRDPGPTARLVADAAGFEDAAVLWQITSSQRPEKGSPARLHLFFITNRPLLKDDRRRLQGALQVKLHAALGVDPKLDLRMALPVQKIFIAPPEFEEGAADPFQRRHGLLPGGAARIDDEMLVAPEPAAAPSMVRGVDMGFLPLGASPLAHFIPDDGPGLHDAILRAAFHIVRAARRGSCTATGLTEHIYEHAERLIDWTAKAPRRPSRAALKKEVRDIVEWVLARQDGALVEDIEPAFPARPTVPLAEAEAAVEGALVAAAGRRGRTVIEVSTGVGKTEAVLQLAKAGKRIAIYVPDHGIATDIARRAAALGVSALVIKGRESLDGEGKPLCKKLKAAAHLKERGITASAQHLCENPRLQEFSEVRDGEPTTEPPPEVCPYAGECEHYNQFDSTAQVVVGQHAMLPLKSSILYSRLPTPDLTVIDENPLPHLIKKSTVAERLLVGTPMAPLLTSDHLEDFDVEACEEFLAGRGRVEGLRPSLDAEQSYAVAQRVPATAVAAAEMIVDCAKAGHESLPAVERRGGYVHFTWLRPIRRLTQTSVLLDATIRPVVQDAIYRRAKRVEVRVDDNIDAYQVHDRTFSKKALKEERAYLKVGDEHARLLSEFGEVGAVTNKEHAEGLGIDKVLWFGALRGRDDLRDVEHGLLFSRIQPPIEEVAKVARVLVPGARFDNPRLVRQPAGYRMADGSRVGTEDFYPSCDGDAGLLREVAATMREDEMLQGLGRFRAVRRAGRMPVTVFGGLPMDVTVKELWSIQDVAEMNVLLRALLEWRVVPLQASLMVAAMPDEFATEKAARRWVEKGAALNARRVVDALRVRETQEGRSAPSDGDSRVRGRSPLERRDSTTSDEERGASFCDGPLPPVRALGGGGPSIAGGPSLSVADGGGAAVRCAASEQAPTEAEAAAPPPPATVRLLHPVPSPSGGRRVALVRFRLERAHRRTPHGHLPLALVHAVDLIDAQRALDRLLRKVNVRDAVAGVWAEEPVRLAGPEVVDKAV